MEARFAADCNLGKLVKWLRILGYDTLYERGNADRSFLMKAGEGGRIALTRKRDLAALPPPGRLVVVKSDHVAGQIGEVLEALKLDPDPARRMTRCLRCNEPMIEVAKEWIEGFVPAYVYERYPRFRRCPCCNGIFWPGTHRRHVEEALKKRSLDRRP
jgi:uncharacterized protein with PIN domain